MVRRRRRRAATDPLHQAELREGYAALKVLAALSELKQALIARRELLEALTQLHEMKES